MEHRDHPVQNYYIYREPCLGSLDVNLNVVNQKIDNFIAELQALEVNDSLVKMVVCTKSSFSLLEKQSFNEFCSALNPAYHVLNRKSLCHKIKLKHDEMIVEFKQKLTSVDSKISLTCDGWSNRLLHGFFVITAHSVASDWT